MTATLERHEVLDQSVVDRLAAYDGPPPCSVLDLGACHGTFGLAAIEKGAECVVSVEATAVNFGVLERIADEMPRIVPILAAVAPRGGEVVAIRCAGNAGQHGRLFAWRYPVANLAVTVGINELLGVVEPDFIKVDIEGDEWRVFEALEPAMLDGVNALDVELHSLTNSTYFEAEGAHFDIWGKLRACGFEVETNWVDGRPPDGGLTGHLFARRMT